MNKSDTRLALDKAFREVPYPHLGNGDSLARKIGNRLWVDKEMWKLLTTYLGYFRRHERMRTTYVQEIGCCWRFWLWNGVCLYSLDVWLGFGCLEFSQFYWDKRIESNVKQVLVKGCLDKHTLLSVWRHLRWENARAKV